MASACEHSPNREHLTVPIMGSYNATLNGNSLLCSYSGYRY